ncbi:MAG TPA: ATP-binding protein [Actinomycetota bacterium]
MRLLRTRVLRRSGRHAGPVLVPMSARVARTAWNEDELSTVLHHVRVAAAEMRAVDEGKTVALRAVAHDLRTPLGVVSGLIEVLQGHLDELEPAQVHQYLTRIAVRVGMMDRLLSNLLDIDRISAGGTAAIRRPTDLAALVSRVIDEADLCGRRVHAEVESGDVAIDEPQVERIVANLLANAVKYAPEASVVSIRAGRSNGGTLIEVADTGPGVPDDLKEVVFEPFQRGSPGPAPGVGIGLAIVAAFARAHGGRAWVVDGPGGGASFRVHLSV